MIRSFALGERWLRRAQGRWSAVGFGLLCIAESWVSAPPLHAAPRGIMADVGAARRSQTLSDALAPTAVLPTSAADDIDRLERSAQRLAKQLYRLSRVGRGARLTRDVDGLRQHLSRIRFLRRRLRGQLERLARLRASTQDDARAATNPSGMVTTEALAATSPSAGSHPSPTKRPTFARRKGRLPHPVSRYDALRPAGRQGGRGVLFDLPSGERTDVRAVFAGKVSFAGEHDAYGKVVVLEHDGGFLTVYAGLDDLSVRRGDTLSARAGLGHIGGIGSEPSLYFEVRRNRRSLLARRWLVH